MDSTELATGDLLDAGIQVLHEVLGADWKIVRQLAPSSPGDRGADVMLQVTSPNDPVHTKLLVDVERRITPLRVEDVLLPKLALVRQVNESMNLLVMAPWIARRTQRMLREHGINYVDLTGNVSIRIPRPAVVVRIEGASRQPQWVAMRGDSGPTLAGSRAGRLVRFLADFAPPYRAAQIAKVADVSLPWVSQLLGLLEDQLLIRRDGRVITSVDWPSLLRARAETFDLLRHNSYVGMLAPVGLGGVQSQLPLPGVRTAVTGSYAARAVAPLAPAGQFMLYVEPGPRSPDVVGDQLGLLPVDDHADVLILRAHDTVVFERSRLIDGVPHVALSQLAIDCLSGPGRMPAEGEAVLEYMVETENSWRVKRLPAE
jgi:hypothetical protein